MCSGRERVLSQGVIKPRKGRLVMAIHDKFGFFVGGCSGSGAPRTFEKLFFDGDTLRKSDFFKRGRFGIRTTSFAIAAGKKVFFVDGGAGIINVNQFLGMPEFADCEVYGVQTHEHEDHKDSIQRNVFLGFRAAQLKKYYWPRLIIGTSMGGDSFKRSFMDWPIGTKVSPEIFMPGQTIDLDEIKVATFLLKHGFDVAKNAPGYSVAYRIETPHGAIVIATDHEIDLQDEKYLRDFAKFVSGAKVLYHDLQYRRNEYDGTEGICGGGKMTRKGWGHSTPDMLFRALELCEKPVEKLVAGHHDPERNEDDLLAFEKEVKQGFAPIGTKAEFAIEGRYYPI